MKSASGPSIGPKRTSSFVWSRPATNAAASSSRRTSMSAIGRPSSPTTRSSPRRFLTGSCTTSRSSTSTAAATGCANSAPCSPNRPSPRTEVTRPTNGRTGCGKLPVYWLREFGWTCTARYQRSEQALVATLTEMYFQGVSTRKVTKVVEQLCGASISASEVSVLVKRLDGDLEAWRTRPLGGKAYRALVVDAHVERVRREGQVRSTAALWVIGIGADGYREHLGVWLGASESGASWRRVFEQLVQRGLTDVEYVVSDEHAGLVDAIRRFFPDALHQRCQVHYLRNALDHVSSPLLAEQVKNGLRDVWAAPTRGEAEQRL